MCQDQLFVSNMERKELHNRVMDLQGKIRVFCRVRPQLEDEMGHKLCVWKYCDSAGVKLSSNKAKSLTFHFDKVFNPNCTQEDIFQNVSPLIRSAVDGYNVSIITYGQTGSGKTYTMEGTSTSPGVIPRTAGLLFNEIEKDKHLGWKYVIKVTCLEIYNEVLIDLLSNEKKDMGIRIDPKCRDNIYVSNITELEVEDVETLRSLMQEAKKNRSTAATVGNKCSSRSHAVTCIELIGRHKKNQESVVGKINFIDLAGSECPKTSLRMEETKKLNLSLFALQNVISALLKKADHIPYRNSKLTHLLMPSLGGNSKTLMFINVAPFEHCYDESVKSLHFGKSVNLCKMTEARRRCLLNPSTSKP